MKSIKTLYHNEWISLKKIIDSEENISGYVFSHETRCDGKIVSILPYRFDYNSSIQYLIRKEVTPCWNVRNHYNSSITGGVEKDDIYYTAQKELYEEAGYKATLEEFVYFGTCFGSKSSDTAYHLFTINLTGKERYPAPGDETGGEVNDYCEWVTSIESCVDPLIYTLHYKLHNYIVR